MQLNIITYVGFEVCIDVKSLLDKLVEVRLAVSRVLR